MWTDEQFDELEQEEHNLTEEAIIALLLTLSITHSELETELRNFYSKYGKDGVVTYQDARKWVSEKNHNKRLTVLLAVISVKFYDLLAAFEEPFRNALTEVISKESLFFNTDLDVDKLITTKWGVDELDWVDRLEANGELWTYNVSKDIKQAFLRRDSIDEVLSELDKRFKSMEHTIKRLVLTESTAMGSIARKEIFKELGVKKYRFYAREDERTCEHCGSLHGLTFPMTAYEVGVTASPIHSHCRCWEVPIVE
jgi:SPP1 gp7 family putative phage head morphogenesis protein